MKIVLLDGREIEVSCEPTDLWGVYKMMADGTLEAFIKIQDRVINVRKVSAETFERLLCEHYRETEPMPPPVSAPVTRPLGSMSRR